MRLGDRQDGYRSELARPDDWIMVGNHDTLPIWAVVQRWKGDGELEGRARYLAERLCRDPLERESFAARLASDPHLIAQAQFADLFASRAKNILVFVSDLLGETRGFNIPGVVDPLNWTLRVPRDYQSVYRERLERSAALDLPVALSLALEAKGLRRAGARQSDSRASRAGKSGHAGADAPICLRANGRRGLRRRRRALLGAVGSACESACLARVHRLVAVEAPAAEAGLLVLADGLRDLGLRIHDEGAILDQCRRWAYLLQRRGGETVPSTVLLRHSRAPRQRSR